MNKIKYQENLLYGGLHDQRPCISGELITPQTMRVYFNPPLKGKELKHARLTAKTAFKQLPLIAVRMNRQKISYREAFIQLTKKGII